MFDDLSSPSPNSTNKYLIVTITTIKNTYHP